MEIKDIKIIAELLIDKSNLEALVHLIIDNAELNYKAEDLRIENEITVLQFIKYLYPNEYKNKLEELKNKKLTNKKEDI